MTQYNTLNVKFSYLQFNKLKSGNLKTELGRLPVLLLKTGLPLTANLLKLLAKSVLVPLGLAATTSATDVAIQKKILGLPCILQT